jgi:2-C-methyl-D-erythritol 2,4-cyclodiphosphate synthase
VSEPQYEYRTGIGTDIHKLVSERPLLLGGVQVPFELGLLGHSDGDVVLHAVIDAILGATGQGDVGTLFPDTDPQWKDAIAGLLETDFANVNIKAKTNEGLDAVGEGRAIACTASVLMRRRIKRTL